MNLYLISILSDDQLKQLTKDMPSDLREKFFAYQKSNQKQIAELKKYFSISKKKDKIQY